MVASARQQLTLCASDFGCLPQPNHNVFVTNARYTKHVPLNAKVEPKLQAHGILMPSAMRTTIVTAVTEDGDVVTTTTKREVRVSQHDVVQTLADDESTAASAARAVAEATNRPTTATASTSVASATGQSIIIVKETLTDGIRCALVKIRQNAAVG